MAGQRPANPGVRYPDDALVARLRQAPGRPYARGNPKSLPRRHLAK